MASEDRVYGVYTCVLDVTWFVTGSMGFLGLPEVGRLVSLERSTSCRRNGWKEAVRYSARSG